MKTALIGTGRLGSSLARALPPRLFSATALFDKDPAAARRLRRKLGHGRVTGSAAEAASAAELVLICVPDGQVAAAARDLAAAEKSWKGKIVLHTSGALSSLALAPLKRAGAAVGSLHPAQSFAGPDTPPARFRGAAFAVEGDPRAAAVGKRLARAVGGRPFAVRAADKPLYHAACSLASNMLVPLFDAACAVLEAAGRGPREAARALLPLVEGTVENLKKLDRAAALTGPIARGDEETVRLHLEALRGRSGAKDVYRRLGVLALELAASRGLDRRTVKRLRRRLAGRSPLPRG